MLVLVRLLDPKAYGQFTVVTSIIGFTSIFSFNNFVAHTLQVRRDEDANFDDHFTAGAVLQIGAFLLTNLAAVSLHWISSFAALAPLLHVMSLTFILEWPCELRRKMIERELDWRRLRLLHAVGLIISAVTAIVMASLGAGVYSLLVPGLAVTFPFVYDLFITNRWRPGWTWSAGRYKAAGQFGVARIGSGLSIYGKQLAESAALASFVGFATLGLFSRSVGLAQMFCQKIASQLMYAIYPVLARVNSDASSTSKHVNGLLLRFVAWAVFPIAIALAMLAKPVVALVYGDKWIEAAPLVPFAMAWGVAAALAVVSYHLLLSTNRPRRCLGADFVSLLGTIFSLGVALPAGLRSYLLATTFVQLVVFTIICGWLIKAGMLTIDGLLAAICPPLVAGATAASCALMILKAIGQVPSSFATALLWSTAFITLYFAALRLFHPRGLAELISYFPARIRLHRAFALPNFS